MKEDNDIIQLLLRDQIVTSATNFDSASVLHVGGQHTNKVHGFVEMGWVG
jgi:hypothetical protein